jgi:hypothetical protein
MVIDLRIGRRFENFKKRHRFEVQISVEKMEVTRLVDDKEDLFYKG